jgi:serine protein kinase
VLEHVVVRRLLISARRTASASARSCRRTRRTRTRTELTGDINYRKIAELGTDSDPRAFNFDGEFCVANRGIIEFIEVLKLDVAFLYDLLTASQEHKIKPKKFAQTDIDEVIIGHTNEPEYNRLQSNELMEAFRDRTIKIDIPYNLRLANEVKIYEKDFGGSVPGQAHRPAHARDRGDVGDPDAPRGAEEGQPVAAAEAQALQRQVAARLHRDNIRELRDEAQREGMAASRRATSRTRSATCWCATCRASTRSW